MPARRPGATRWALPALFALSALVRLHGAWIAPPLSGFDGPFHAANIGVILFEGRLPLPNEGWATFHPPFYYAVSAALWALLPDALSSHAVLFALRLLNVAASMLLGLAVWLAAREVVPARPFAALCATALALFLPMEMGPSFQVGNEMFGATLSAVAIALLLRCLRAHDATAPLWALGIVLGLAVLTKFNTASVALGAAISLLAVDLRRRGLSPSALSRVALVTAVALAIAGWYFAWNLHLYGTPVQMQNDVLTAHMARSGYGPTRDLSAYLSLRPDVLTLRLDALLAADQGATKPPVWPVTFATTWFDSFSTVLFAPSPAMRPLGWILFACGALFTALVGWGAAALLREAPGSPERISGQALLCLIGLALAAYVGFTWKVATFSALKGSYLSPALLPLCLLAGIGCDALARAGPAIARGAVALLVAVFVTTSTIAFTAGPRSFPLDPATLYVQSYSDAAIDRVYRFFVQGPRRDTAPPARESAD
jgi:4-amino-4-deoxy-L-arabinose transferase-like glycosyltransferase